MRPILFLLILIAPEVLYCQVTDRKDETGEIVNKKIVSDRPGISAMANLVPAKMFQIESGYNYELKRKADSEKRLYTYNTSILRYGISTNCEFRLGMEFNEYRFYDLHHSLESRVLSFSPVSIGAKLFITQGKGIVPSVSFMSHIYLPYIEAKQVRSPYIAAGFGILAQNSLHDKLMLVYNLGAHWDGVTPNAIASYAFCANYSIVKNFDVFIELYGEFSETTPVDASMDAGIVYQFSPSLQVDLSGGISLAEGFNDGFYSFGFSWLLPKR